MNEVYNTSSLLPPHTLEIYDVPLTTIDPSAVARINPNQANPSKPIPIMALGLINNVKANSTTVTAM